MTRSIALLTFVSIALVGCDSGNGSTPGMDATADTAVETGSDATPGEAATDGAADSSIDALGPETAADARPDVLADGALDATPDQSTDAAIDADGGPCTAPLDAFHCPAAYPSDLRAACGTSSGIVSTASCSSLAAIVYGGPPHYSFCLYAGADAGALIGAQSITDINEFCGGTAYLMTGGQVPVTCHSEVYAQLGPPDSGSTSATCDGGGAPRDAALDHVDN